MVEMIKLVKEVTVVSELQKQFFEEAENPLKAKQEEGIMAQLL